MRRPGFARPLFLAALCAGVTYDPFTHWPAGFDPRARGAALDVPGRDSRRVRWTQGGKS